MKVWSLLLTLGLGIAACGRTPGPPRLVRLLPEPGAAKQIGPLTRHAVPLRPGEKRAFPAEVAADGTLLFAWALQGEAPRATVVELTVASRGRPVLRRRLPARPEGSWWAETVPVPAAGAASIEFAAEGGAVLLSSPRLYVPGPARQRRCLIWISVDTERADRLGAYGYRRPTSPVFDRLAREAVLFENAVAPASWTLPSLASQFTSRYPTFHGAVLQKAKRDATLPTLFELLGRDGFTVVGVTGNRFVSPRFDMARGFDALWFTEGNAAEINRVTLGALADWGGGDLALFVHYMDPHIPYAPPPPFKRSFDPDYRGTTSGSNFLELTARADPKDLFHVSALYDGELAYTDQMIGELLNELTRRGLLENAVLVYTADHGEEFLEHDGWQHSRTLYEEMLRVPFALRLPGTKPQRVAQPVSLVDLAPTALEFFGVRSPASFQGRSRLPLTRGGAPPERPLFAETERDPAGLHRVAVRRGAQKLILTVDRGPDVPPRVRGEEMFDLAVDPLEKQPLADGAARAALRREALAYLTMARREARSGGEAELTPELERELRALGYVQ